MKTKKIAAILAITLTGSYIIPTNAIAATVTNKVVLAQHVQSETSTEKNNDENNTSKDNKNVDANTTNTSSNNTQNFVATSGLAKTSIQIINGWGTPAGLIKFDQNTQKIQVSQYNRYLGHDSNQFLKIEIYNPKAQKVVSVVNLNGNDNTNALSKVFNNESFDYGDQLIISYDSSQGQVIVNNGRNSIGNSSGLMEVFTIAKGGLEKTNEIIVPANPVDVLEGATKVTNGVITGKVNPNETVSAVVNGKIFNGKSNASGNYSITIEDSNGFTSSTKIELNADGYLPNTVTPVLNENIQIQNSSIQIINAWGTPAGLIKFDPNEQKIRVSQYNNYLGQNTNQFLQIGIYNPKTQKIISLVNLNGNDSTNALSKVFNNKSFNYGDQLFISYDSSQGQVVVKNGENITGNSTGSMDVFTIAKGGLEQIYETNVNVNPLDILSGQQVVKSATLTGNVTPNTIVTADVNGKTFESKSNVDGSYSINIEDSDGFNINTSIQVNADGFIPSIINPEFNENIGILNSSILIHGEVGVVAQNITFNPNTMTVSNNIPWGGQFSAELIDKDTGKVVASSGIGNFNIDGTKETLNGASFKFGDIISVYEAKQENLSFGNIELSQGGNTSYIDADEKFQSYEITPQGLIPVANKNLTVSDALYNGTQVIPITGKTMPNTDVKVFYNGNTAVVKSNADGDFSLNVPFDKTSIGSEMRIFVNNQNNQNLIVRYDQKQFTIQNNAIQIINNEGFPVINIGFNAALQKITSIPYPRTVQYSGVFYGNRINIKLIDGKTGKVIKNVISNKSGEITSFAQGLNNVAYKSGDIIEIQYDNSLVSANVISNKKNIGNTTGNAEYFEITNAGLEEINNQFINVNPLAILSNQKVTKCNLTGKVSKNEEVTVNVDGQSFKGMSDGNGDFNIPLSLASGFTQSTQIIVSANGYKPTTIEPTFEKSINLMNSYINFYNSNGNMGDIISSIGFNLENGSFIINNYANNFGGNASNYFTLGLYNKDGKAIFNDSFNGESTSQLNEKLGKQKFELGDIIALSYNPSISKPMIVNGSNVIGNVSGQKEYFEITKEGLVRVNFGSNSTTKSVNFNNGTLDVNLNLAYGNNISNGNLVILNSDNKVIGTGSEIKTVGEREVEGTIPADVLSKIDMSQMYTIALDLNGKIQPIYVNSNTFGNETYNVSENSQNELQINKKAPRTINIENSNDLATCLNDKTEAISKSVNANNINEVLSNQTLKNNMLVTNFINTIGLQNLEKFFNESKNNANFIKWVLNNPIAMTEFLNAPSPNGNNVVQCQTPGTYTQALGVWSDIWNTYTSSHNGFDLKLAIATAITNAGGITAFPTSQSVGSPVQRYEIFKTLNDEGRMLPIFKTLDVTYLTYVVDTIIPNNEILEMRDIILQNHNAFVNSGYNGLSNIAYTIHYNEINPYTGASIFGDNFYGPHPTISNVWYDGGVCGEISRMGTMALQVFGAPAAQSGQPGHDAFLYFTPENQQWNVGNDIFGWNESEGSDISGWSTGIAQNNNVACYNLVYEKAQKNLPQSNEYVLLSNTNISYASKVAALKEAIKLQPLNINAWKNLIGLCKSNSSTTLAQYNELGDKITSLFSSYTIPMSNLLHYLYEGVLQNAIEQATISEEMNQNVALKSAITNAQEVLQSSNVTQNQILNALKALTNEENSISLQLKNQLQMAITSANKLINSGKYTEKSEQDLEKLVKAGSKFLNSKDLNTLVVENIIAYLNSSEKELVIKKKTPEKIEVKNNAETLYFANISGSEALVINGDIDGVTIPGNISKQLVIEDSNGQVVDTINTTPVNWYSKNKENYSGYQGIISGNILSKLETGTNYKVGIKYDGQIHMLSSNIELPSYGQYRVEISNGNVAIQKSSIISQGIANCEIGYAYNGGFIINANVDLNGVIIPANAQKQIVITDKSGKTIYENNTISVNWYSKNKENYSGLQAYIPESELSKLNGGENYSLSILVTEGNEKYSMPIKGNANADTDGYKLFNNSGILTITKEQNVNVIAKIENKYQDKNSTVINVMMDIDNVPAGSNVILKITENNGTVKEVNGVLVNWYSKDKNNLNGVQFIINSNDLKNAKTSNIVVSVSGKNYNCNLGNI
ncbi:MAG: hypothetical protein ACRC57_14310 [Sarcina sp.]